MPIQNFDGDTFVAFTDISGFKKMVENRQRAEAALHDFFQTAYHILDENVRDNAPTVEGILVSDCGVFFVRPNNANQLNCLRRLLQKIGDLNRQLLPRRVMLSTSIGYGHFQYQDRIEFDGMNKNPIFGRGYLRAYLDTQLKRPRLECGYCRLVREGLPDNVIATLERENPNDPFSMIRPLGRTHFNYYWMRNNPNEIQQFERAYKDSENLKFEGIRQILAGATPQIFAN